MLDRRLILLCAAALLAPGGAWSDAPGAARRVVRYDGDRQVVVPQTITRVATAWEAQNSVLAMLGYGDRIVATTRVVRGSPVFRKFVPTIADAALVSTDGTSDLNVEQLMLLKPDVLFGTVSIPQVKREQLERAGIAVAMFRANSLAALVERTLVTGEILGEDALRIARDYQQYFEHNRQRVAAALARVPAQRRLKVYHSMGSPWATSGRPSLNQDWMDLGGAVNVAEHWFGGSPNASGQTSIESIVAADPDVIVAMRVADAEDMRSNPQWKNIRAVRNGRVYANPRGLFWWGRETSEQALQFLWLAKTLYPEALPEVDMPAETKAFYKRFYRIELSDDEAREFLAPRQ